MLRLTDEGAPAPGNPWASRGGIAAQFWTIGHRNLLGIAFEGSLPHYRYAERRTLDLLGEVQEQAPVILLVQVDLRIRKQSIDGHMLFLLSVTSLHALLDSIDRFLARQGIG